MTRIVVKLLNASVYTIPRRWRGATSIDGLFIHSRNHERRSPYPPSLLSNISQYKNHDVVLPSFNEKQVYETTKLVQAAVTNIITDPQYIGRLFAIVQMRGKQRLVTTEDLLMLEGHFPADVGERIRLEKVLLVGSKDFTFVGRPLLTKESVKVEATVVEKTVDHTKPVFYQISKGYYRRIHFHQSPLCVLRINSITIDPELIPSTPE